MLYRNGKGYLKWMGLQDENNVLGPYIVKHTNIESVGNAGIL